MGDFLQALTGTVLVHEGGRVDDPDDPGLATVRGISLRFLRSQGIDVDGDGDVDAADVWALEDADVERLYRRYFWNLVHGDDLRNQAMATKLFDTAVNMGVPRAIRIAQAAAGITADGSFGPQTFRALDVQAPAALLNEITIHQLAFYRAIVAKTPKAAKWIPGWTRRANCTLLTPCIDCRMHAKRT